MLTNRINQINYRMMQLSQQQQTLANNAATLERALANQKTVFQTIGNVWQSHLTMQQQQQTTAMYAILQNSELSAEERQTQLTAMTQAFGGLGLNGMFNFATTPQGMIFTAMQQQMETINQTKLQQVKDMENEIQLQMKSLETQLKAAQEELQQVEKAEENNIKNSAPKFA